MDAIYVAGAIVGVATPCLAGLVWLIRLEGRINTETALREALLAPAPPVAPDEGGVP